MNTTRLYRIQRAQIAFYWSCFSWVFCRVCFFYSFCVGGVVMRKKVYSVADLIKIEAEKAEARATALVSQDRCSKRQQEYLRCTFQLSVYDEVLSLIQQHDNGDLAADVLQVAKTKAKYTERKHQVSQKMVMLETLIELYPGNDPVSVGKRGGYKSSLSHAKQQLKECDEKLKSVGYGRQQ